MRGKQEYHGWPQILSGGIHCTSIGSVSFSDSAIVGRSLYSYRMLHGLQITSGLESTAFSSTAPPPSRRAHPPLQGFKRLCGAIVYGAVVYPLALTNGSELWDRHGRGGVPHPRDRGQYVKWAIRRGRGIGGRRASIKLLLFFLFSCFRCFRARGIGRRGATREMVLLVILAPTRYQISDSGIAGGHGRRA
ncbi:hypothetical protein B0H16DRAFT_899795 [Mycena metata]|uniref:Uncharacterized protein n=1 Tax=Mycena metata TaxID=1033252 RepID=A0AAD7GGL5_9AGAR|nr:hypothetical protein B0H16DRAFT_899795 [Mycena metata]